MTIIYIRWRPSTTSSYDIHTKETELVWILYLSKTPNPKLHHCSKSPLWPSTAHRKLNWNLGNMLSKEKPCNKIGACCNLPATFSSARRGSKLSGSEKPLFLLSRRSYPTVSTTTSHQNNIVQIRKLANTFPENKIHCLTADKNHLQVFLLSHLLSISLWNMQLWLPESFGPFSLDITFFLPPREACNINHKNQINTYLNILFKHSGNLQLWLDFQPHF